MGARDYNPGLGVFTTEDSVAGQAADPPPTRLTGAAKTT